MRSAHLSTLIVLVASFGCAEGVQAQVQRSAGGASAQLVQQYQQAVSERAQIQTDNNKLKGDLDVAKKELALAKQKLAAFKSSASSATAQLNAAQAASETAAQGLEKTKSQLQEVVNRYRDTATTLRQLEAERTHLQQQFADSNAAFDQCAERNYLLYQVNGEVLDRYEHQGAFSYLARGEPFTRIKRTQIENLVDEYRTRAQELRVQKQNAGSSFGTGTSVPEGAPSAANSSRQSN